MARKEPVDEVAALREATREAHETIQSLRTERAACEKAKAELEEARASLADMMKAIWDAQMETVVDAALNQYNVGILKAIEDGTEAVYERFEKIADMMMNPQNHDVEVVMKERENAGSMVEALVMDKVLEWHLDKSLGRKP